MIDSLDEAIAHCKEKAKELREQAGFETDNLRYMMSDSERQDCLECASEHEQLASWLEELKARREADRWISVQERLPEETGYYLVTIREPVTEKIVFLATDWVKFHKREENNANHGFDSASIVIAWKPLPKPYESEDE